VVGAQNALEHAKERGTEIKVVFSRFQILQSEYSVHAGFNESLITSGVGYIQEIHVFTSREVPTNSLITELGKLFSPYPGTLFTPSGSHHTPVFKKDGSIRDFDELVLSRAENYTSLLSSGTIKSDLVVAHVCAVRNDAASSSSSACSSNGGRGGGNEGSGSGREHGGGRRQEDQNPGGHPINEGNWDGGPSADGDPEDPNGKGKSTRPFPDVSFDVLANIYCDCDEDSTTSTLFQAFQMNGRLTAKVGSVSSISLR
jgi:hypothetical protein